MREICTSGSVGAPEAKASGATRRAYSRGRNQQARFQTAAGSARETLACLETAEALGFIGPLSPELGARFDHVIGTLVRLSEPRNGVRAPS